MTVGELYAVDSFGFHRMEERFHRRIVRHLSAEAVHTLDESKFSKSVAKIVGTVLGASITVKDSPRLRFPMFNGIAECPQGQVRVPIFAHGPADDTPGELVQNDSEIAPLAACPEVRNVSDPDLVRFRRNDAIAVVRDGVEELFDPGFQSVDPRTASFEAPAAHQSLDAFASDANTAFAQRVMDSRTAIEAAALAVDRLDLRSERFVFEAAATAAASFPCVVAGAGHAVDSTQRLYFVFFPVLLDEREDFSFRSEQNRMAFFSRACSSLRMACSFSSCRNRSNSEAIGGVSMSGLSLSTMSPSRHSLRQRESMNG